MLRSCRECEHGDGTAKPMLKTDDRDYGGCWDCSNKDNFKLKGTPYKWQRKDAETVSIATRTGSQSTTLKRRIGHPPVGTATRKILITLSLNGEDICGLTAEET